MPPGPRSKIIQSPGRQALHALAHWEADPAILDGDWPVGPLGSRLRSRVKNLNGLTQSFNDIRTALSYSPARSNLAGPAPDPTGKEEVSRLAKKPVAPRSTRDAAGQDNHAV